MFFLARHVSRDTGLVTLPSCHQQVIAERQGCVSKTYNKRKTTLSKSRLQLLNSLSRCRMMR
jgi:hypothetical protein